MWFRITEPVAPMPPKNKLQLTANEKALIRLWIEIGAPDAAQLLPRSQRPDPQALQDPNHNHGKVCHFSQPQGANGLARQPDEVQLLEEEHEWAARVAGDSTATVAPEVGISFEKQMLPLFTAKCAACHIQSTKGDLSLKTVADIIKGGASGPALVPGSLFKSMLWEMVDTDQMPPQDAQGGKLTRAEKDLIRRWIMSKE
jgi:hypothetical protein